MTGEHPLSAGWREHPRYPDPAVEILDERFAQYRIFSAAVERLYTGCRWAEGPVWFGDGRYLLWSDIPNNRILKWEEETGAVSVFRKPSNFANGNTRDRQGRLVTCEHGRRVTRTEYDGTITVLLDRFAGQAAQLAQRRGREVRRLDLVHRPAVRHPRPLRGPQGRVRAAAGVYRIDGESGEASVRRRRRARARTASASRPTSACSTSSSRAASRTARSWPTTSTADGRELANKRVLIDAGPGGTPDGMRCDVDGNLWCGWGMGSAALDGVLVFAPDGSQIGRIALPERCANVCFGGLEAQPPVHGREPVASTRSTSTPRALRAGKAPGAAAEPGRAAARRKNGVHHK